AAYLNEAKNLAENQHLEFLEFVDKDGTIISSAQSPAAYGYKEPLITGSPLPKDAFLRKENTSDGPALVLSAAKVVTVGDQPLYVIGGKRLDKAFLESLELPVGMRTMLYQNFGANFDPSFLISPGQAVAQPQSASTLIHKVQESNSESNEIIH